MDITVSRNGRNSVQKWISKTIFRCNNIQIKTQHISICGHNKFQKWNLSFQNRNLWDFVCAWKKNMVFLTQSLHIDKLSLPSSVAYQPSVPSWSTNFVYQPQSYQSVIPLTQSQSWPPLTQSPFFSHTTHSVTVYHIGPPTQHNTCGKK